MQRKSTNPSNVEARRKKKKTKADLNREYGVPATATLRYTGIKGIAWYWFARYVRLRDYLKWGRCISCGKPKTLEELQAGHFMPAGSCGLDLLMDEQNVNGECGGCNGFDDTHLLWYEQGLNERFGPEVAASLKERYQCRHQSLRQISTHEWEEMARHYKEAFERLSQGETA